MSSGASPCASRLRISSTEIRIPRTMGLPPKTSRRDVMRSRRWGSDMVMALRGSFYRNSRRKAGFAGTSPNPNRPAGRLDSAGRDLAGDDRAFHGGDVLLAGVVARQGQAFDGRGLGRPQRVGPGGERIEVGRQLDDAIVGDPVPHP